MEQQPTQDNISNETHGSEEPPTKKSRSDNGTECETTDATPTINRNEETSSNNNSLKSVKVLTTVTEIPSQENSFRPEENINENVDVHSNIDLTSDMVNQASELDSSNTSLLTFNNPEQFKFMAQQIEATKGSIMSRLPKINLFSRLEARQAANNDKLPDMNSSIMNNSQTDLLGTCHSKPISITSYPINSTVEMNIPIYSLAIKESAIDSLPLPIQTNIYSLLLLDSLASQIIKFLCLGSMEKIFQAISEFKTNEEDKQYHFIRTFFTTRSLYSDKPFLTIDDIIPPIESIISLSSKDVDINNMVFNYKRTIDTILKLKGQEIDAVIRKTNIATFMANIFSVEQNGFVELDKHFLDVFIPYWSLFSGKSASSDQFPKGTKPPLHGKMLKGHGSLYLDLKTQAYIAAMQEESQKEDGQTKENLLNDLFPKDLKKNILNIRHGELLTTTEEQFVGKCLSRREILEVSGETDEELSTRYDWFKFLKELIDFVSKNLDTMIFGSHGPSSSSTSLQYSSTFNHNMITASLNTNNNNGSTNSNNTGHNNGTRNGSSDPSRKRQRSQTRSVTNIATGSNTADLLTKGELGEEEWQGLKLTKNTGDGKSKSITPRRPWNKEEEMALRKGLEAVGGPFWAQILELYGAGGKFGEQLKDRNQIQLKDKARNWKMFFIKNGGEVPEYLSKVTGDIQREKRTRRKRSMSPMQANPPAPQNTNQLSNSVIALSSNNSLATNNTVVDCSNTDTNVDTDQNELSSDRRNGGDINNDQEFSHLMANSSHGTDNIVVDPIIADSDIRALMEHSQ